MDSLIKPLALATVPETLLEQFVKHLLRVIQFWHVSRGGTFNSTTCSCNCPASFTGTACQIVKPSCTSILACQNGGTFNLTTCLCNCPADFTGTTCQTVKPSCNSTLTCQNGGTFNSTTCSCNCPAAFTGTTCQTATAVATSCPPQNCLNGFTFNALTCTCQCGSGFSGPLCQSYNCQFTPVPDNAICSDIPCDGSEFINGNCPFKCLCGGSNATVISSCTPLACANAFTFDANTCNCRCGTGFSGSRCEFYQCATQPAPDNTAVCPILPCDGSDYINGNCPLKCLCRGDVSKSLVQG